MARLHEL